MLKNQSTRFGFMIVALLGLFSVQAFWIYETINTHNQRTETSLQEAASRIKREVEEDFYCFKLNTQTDIMDSDFLSIVKSHSNKPADTLENYRLKNEDTALIYPKHVFNYEIPVRVQFEMKFDYLIDSISAENLKKPDIQSFADEYRYGSIVDSVNGVRVSYVNSLDTIIKNVLNPVLQSDEIYYSIAHFETERLVYQSGEKSGKEEILSIILYDDDLKFAEPYKLTIFSKPLFLKIFIALGPFLLATLLIFIVGTLIIIHWLQVWRKEKMVADFQKDMMHSVSHEMNTPISNIRLAVRSLMEPKHNQPADAKKYLQIIEQENRLLGENIALMMDYIQVEQGEMPLQLKPIELSNLLANVVNSFQDRVDADSGILTLENPENEVWIKADETHIINVFYNLLDNALKHSEESPEIKVRLHVANQIAIIEFEDNCNPIEAKQLSKIFEKFYRVPKSKVEGQGIGLYYVKLIIQKLNGKIHIYPSSLGGNVFEITLPVSK